MGDNGFALGEHGFYDKRDAFEESIESNVGLFMETFYGLVVDEMIQNIDIAPTICRLRK